MGYPLVRVGFVQSTIAVGLKNAGVNANGALAGFMGMGMGMQSSGSFMGAASNTNMAQMQMNQMPGGQWQGAAGMPYGQGMPGAAGAAGMPYGQGMAGAAGNAGMPGAAGAGMAGAAGAGMAGAAGAGMAGAAGAGMAGAPGAGMPGEGGAPEAGQGQPVPGQAGAQAESHPAGWTCPRCQNENHGKFCSECGSPRPVSESWVCSCGTQNTGKFCSECGKPRP